MKLKILLLFLIPLALWSCEKDDNDTLRVITIPVSDIFYDPDTDLADVVLEGAIKGNAGKIYERGFIWSKLNKFDFVKAPASLTGDFVLELGDLEKDVVYYVKAYALTSKDTYYGEVLSFVTSTLPFVHDYTDYVNNLTATTLLVEACVVSNGGTDLEEYGIKYGVAGSQDRETVQATEIDLYGNFNIDLRGLDHDTEYVMNIYAVNSHGEKISDDITFRTKDLSTPSAALDASDPFPTVNPTRVIVRANVSDNGGDPDLEFGVKYGTSAGSLTSIALGTEMDEYGNYEVPVMGLDSDKDYYFAAYVKNPKYDYTSAPQMQHTPMPTQPVLESLDLVAGKDYFDNVIVLVTTLGSDGGLDIEEMGFYVGTSPNPQGKYVVGSVDGNGQFGITLTEENNIQPLTDYYIRAFAKNSIGQTETPEVMISTGIGDNRPGGETYRRSEEMNFTSQKLAYWPMDPIEVDINGDGVNDTKLTFLDRNLGATELPTSSALNINAVGSFYRWGADKPQASSAMAWIVIDPTSSYSSMPARNGVPWYGWGEQPAYPNNDLTGGNTWGELSQSGKAFNPCPEGFHVPTRREWIAAFEAKNVTDLDGLFTHFNFCLTGDFAPGGACEQAGNCRFWTDNGNNDNDNNPQAEFINSGNPQNPTQTTGRKRSMVIRCVKTEALP